METLVCDLCGANDTTLLYDWHEWEQALPAGIKSVRCRSCGLIYLNPRPDRAEMGSYYPAEYGAYRKAVEDERLRIMRWVRRRKLDHLRRVIERYSGLRKGRVLDVGCATGLFLHEMALAGWQATGVEPSPFAARYARERFGLDVHEGLLEGVDLPSGFFDVVTYWDVLEHTFAPRAELTRINRLLRRGGLLAVNVPNWRSPDRWIFGPYWIGFDPPRHLYVFTRATLTRLLEETGFRPAAWACVMPTYFAFTASVARWSAATGWRVARVVKRLLSLPGARLLFEPGFTLMNRLRAGGVITVFAIKQ